MTNLFVKWRELRALLNLYLKSAKWRHVWVFYHCKYHAAMADDAIGCQSNEGLSMRAAENYEGYRI